MIKKLQSQMKNKKGFTLIEIIVVLVILAILVAIALPAMFGYVEEARAKTFAQEARVGFLAAQWVVAEAALTAPNPPGRFIAAANAAAAINFAGAAPAAGITNGVTHTGAAGAEQLTQARANNIWRSFMQKVDGVAFPQFSNSGTNAAPTSTGFRAVTVDGEQVVGITYVTADYTIVIDSGLTTTPRNAATITTAGAVLT
jgi:type IV pilus assembly protein PilA